MFMEYRMYQSQQIPNLGNGHAMVSFFLLMGILWQLFEKPLHYSTLLGCL